MRYIINACTKLTELDLRSFGPSSLDDLFCAFSGCTSLTTIWADPSRALPDGIERTQTFRQCKSLVGDAGTA